MPAVAHRLKYGNDSLAFGDLRLPEGAGPHPVAVVIHGGCWRAEHDLQPIAALSGALTGSGVATWTIEYRRVGDTGGGWTGTFEDVARAADFLPTLSRQFPLDLGRVVLVGHSAGGHLALWLAARPNLPRECALYSGTTTPVRGVVSLAGITDLRSFGAGLDYCNRSVALLLGGSPAEVPERYAAASPIELLPLALPTRLLHGTADAVVPVYQSQTFAEQASARGDDARFLPIEGAGHFDLIDPSSSAWSVVVKAVLSFT
jgi:acetyl esterase/lipase